MAPARTANYTVMTANITFNAELSLAKTSFFALKGLARPDQGTGWFGLLGL
jgi:hypothetical protein